MAGCYGNSPEDRYWEAQLDKYLDDGYNAEMYLCDNCDESSHPDDMEVEDDGYTCPNCGELIPE